MKLIFNKIKHKQVMETGLWVSECGSSVFKEQPCGKFKKLSVNLVSCHGYQVARVKHNLKSVTPTMRKLVLLAWHPCPINYNAFGTCSKNNNPLDFSKDNIYWKNWCERKPAGVNRVLNSGIYISKDSKLILKLLSSGDWRIISSCKEKSGYVVVGHNDKGLTRYRHRLVALAWNNPPSNWETLEVNHLNNTPGDDYSENLEWVTPQGNCEHAILNGSLGNGTVYCRSLLTNNITKHISLKGCLKGFGKYGYSSDYRQVKRSVKIINGYTISYLEESAPTITDFLIQTDLALIADDGQLVLFKSIKELARYLNLDRNILGRKIRKHGSSAVADIVIYFLTGGVLITINEKGQLCSHRKI